MNPNHGRPPAPKEREPLPLDDAMLDSSQPHPPPDDAHRLEACMPSTVQPSRSTSG
jgi:hypothetical protein